MSSDNPYQAPTTRSSGVDKSESVDRDRLRKIASAQRNANVAVLLYIGIFPVAFAIGAISGGAAWAGVAILAYVIGVMVLGAVSVYRLAAIFRGNVVAVIYVIGLLVPLLGLLLLLSISGKATKELKEAGIKVGLLGANPNSI